MIKLEQILNANVIRIVSDGELSNDDVATATCQLKSFINTHGKIAVLEQVLQAGQSATSLLWDRIAAESDFVDRITHIAVVCNLEVMDIFSAVFLDSEPAGVPCFQCSEYDDAVAWLAHSSRFQRPRRRSFFAEWRRYLPAFSFINR